VAPAEWELSITTPESLMSFYRQLLVIGLLGLLTMNAHAVPPEGESCAQIREQIAAQTGLLPKPDTVLLEKLGTHQECGFTSAEVYRAAYADKPLPPRESREVRHRHGDDDDD